MRKRTSQTGFRALVPTSHVRQLECLFGIIHPPQGNPTPVLLTTPILRFIACALSLHNEHNLLFPTSNPTSVRLWREILSLSASWVINFAHFVPATFKYNHNNVDVQNARFCNITVTYTHPGYKDMFNVETWLPPHDKWNGILQVTGGGG
ncbi:uncharacterized protein BO96DRAFT_447232 [Aspergillus niger CBS 101883]|uniref:uncharacterized protein n=1 Tax=Aspergillus lacticoffeatus (strain CBS 101883) TaxID=1450533 RepID=UPI000D7F1B09|nr:uncharacterized protein BO96DRAFT_447232 [Aspergillus niger CBS 101883]PYH55384.1 hypothetical protein BO96DRAFT_447232 [Aspergillus niger CBS 101883]